MVDPRIPLGVEAPNVLGNTLATMGHLQQQRQQQQMQQQQMDLQGRRVTLDEQQFAQQQLTAEQAAEATQALARADRVGRAFAAILSRPPAEHAQAYAETIAGLQGEGIDVSKFPPQFPGTGWVISSARQALSLKDQLTLLQNEQPKPAEPYTLTPGSKRFGPNDQEVASVPTAPPAPPPGFNLSPGQTRFSGTGEQIASLPAAPEKPAPPGSFEQQIADALSRGDQATVDRLTKASELASGARARTQGRPVTSGDTNRVADFNTSLDDVAVLETTITGNKATGTAAKVGASVPNWVTEITGWGADAKSKQAVIDRVKQVIGKALEGGVLRKEDEYKYTKILPTIGDVPSVVLSKLKGLKEAITLRRQTLLDSLQDSGYDVSEHTTRATERDAAGKKAPDVLNGQKPGRYTLSDGSVWEVRGSGDPVKVQ